MEEIDELDLPEEALEDYINQLTDEILELLKKGQEKNNNPIFFVGYG